MTVDRLRLVVVGAHLSGQPLNHQLTARGATLVGATRTAASYRLLALPTDPPKPGLQRLAADDPAGRSIEVEVWSLSPAAFADFVDAIPAPLGVGRLQLADGSEAAGFICEPIGLADATDITSFGGWRAYRAAVDEPR